MSGSSFTLRPLIKQFPQQSFLDHSMKYISPLFLNKFSALFFPPENFPESIFPLLLVFIIIYCVIIPKNVSSLNPEPCQAYLLRREPSINMRYESRRSINGSFAISRIQSILSYEMKLQLGSWSQVILNAVKGGMWGFLVFLRGFFCR